MLTVRGPLLRSGYPNASCCAPLLKGNSAVFPDEIRGPGERVRARAMWNSLLGMIDWFVPDEAKHERTELALARNFVFTHLFGPLLAQSICLFLYLTDPSPGLACWTVIG